LYNIEKEFEVEQTFISYSAGNQNYAKVAFNYIANNFMCTITIQEVADFIGISRSYLYRLFRDEYGLSPQYLLIGYRMNRASQLLTEEDKIYMVAEQGGYHNQLHFSKAFKKHYGLSSQDYRRRWEKVYSYY